MKTSSVWGLSRGSSLLGVILSRNLPATPGSLLLIALLGLGFTNGTKAQEAEVAATAHDADREARALFEAGQIAFDAARFEDALSSFQRSYELSQRHALLYNIGLAAYRARNDQLAIESFERFVELEPDHPNAEQARGRLRTLQNQQLHEDGDRGGERDEGGDGNEADPSPGEQPIAPSRTGPWVLGIGGGAAVIAGTVLLAVALSTKSDVESQEAPVWSDISSDVDSVPALSGAGIALMAVGGAAVIGAILWRLLTPGGEPELAVGFGPDRLIVEGQF